MVLGSASCAIYGSVTHLNVKRTGGGELITTATSIGML